MRGITSSRKTERSFRWRCGSPSSATTTSTQAQRYRGIWKTFIKTVSREVCLKDDSKLRKDDIFICLRQWQYRTRRQKSRSLLKTASNCLLWRVHVELIRPVKPERSAREVPASAVFALAVRNNLPSRTDRPVPISTNLNLRLALLTSKFPLPPLEVQKEIVAEIEGYQKVIDGARAVLDHYRPHIPIHPDWPTIQLSEICSFKNGLNFDQRRLIWLFRCQNYWHQQLPRQPLTRRWQVWTNGPAYFLAT